MGFLIPAAELSINDLKALKLEIATELLRRAAAQTGKPVSDFVVRDIFPLTDFSDSTPTWANAEWTNQTQSVANTWTKDWYKTLNDTTFVAFYGFEDHVSEALPGGAVAEGFPYLGIQYKVGASGSSVREQVHLQIAQRMFYVTSGDNIRIPVGFHMPVYYDARETIYVALNSNATVSANADEFELLGMICEALGSTISSIDPEINPGQIAISYPEDEITIEDVRALREQTKQLLLSAYVKMTGKPRDSAVVRDIFPYEDIGNGAGTGWNGVEWQNQTAISAADTWTKDWSKELPKTKFIGFYGVDYKKAADTQAAWKYMGVSYKVGSAGASTRKQVHLQKSQKQNIFSAGAVKSSRCYHGPVIYNGAETIYISLMAKATVTQYYDQIQLLGLCVEPYGATISG